MSAPPALLPAADLADPVVRKLWLDAVRLHTEDAIAAGLDVSARKCRRVLSRAEARRQLKASGAGLAALLDAAEAPKGRAS